MLIAAMFNYSLLEVDGNRVAAADDDANALLRLRLILPGKQRRECCRATRFSDYSQRLPKSLLCLKNRLIGNQYHTVYIFSGKWKYLFTDASRRKGIRRDASGFRINRAPC